MHIGLGLEFKQAPILAEGLAEAAVHHDWYYTAYIDACALEARKPDKKKLSLIECFEKALLDEKITSCSSWDYSNQFEPPSEKYPDGRWFVAREPYRDGVVGLVKNELAGCAGGWQVRPEDDLERATAELINISSKRLPTNRISDHARWSPKNLNLINAQSQSTSPPRRSGPRMNPATIFSSSTAPTLASGTRSYSRNRPCLARRKRISSRQRVTCCCSCGPAWAARPATSTGCCRIRPRSPTAGGRASSRELASTMTTDI